MHLTGIDGKWQQVLMFEKCLFKIKTITDNNILRTEHRARKMTTIGATEHLDQKLIAFNVVHQLMNKLTVFHEISSCSTKRMRRTFEQSKLRANIVNTEIFRSGADTANAKRS